MKKLLLVTIIIIMWCGGCADTKVTKGPALLRVYQDRAAVMWESNTDGPQQVRYGSDKKLVCFVTSTPEKIEYQVQPSPNVSIKKTAFVRKIWLENLKPGQVYTYRIPISPFESKIYNFRTLPADAGAMKFVVYGDSRSDPENHKRIVEQIIKTNPDFVIHTGDLVANGDKYEQWGPQFFEPVKGLAENTAIYITKGNHERKGGNFEKLFIPAGEEKNFGLHFGPLYYYLADNYSEDLPDKELLNLIVENVQNAEAEWKFVSFHIPALNFGGHNSKWGHPDALPAFAKAGADFVITGHSHMYERFWPIAPPLNTDGNIVTYITTGGGGAPLAKNINRTDYHADVRKILHFCLFKIKDNHLTMDVIDIDGNVIDHLEISKTAGKLNEKYLQKAIPMDDVLLQQSLQKTAAPKSPATVH